MPRFSNSPVEPYPTLTLSFSLTAPCKARRKRKTQLTFCSTNYSSTLRVLRQSLLFSPQIWNAAALDVWLRSLLSPEIEAAAPIMSTAPLKVLYHSFYRDFAAVCIPPACVSSPSNLGQCRLP